MAMDTWSSWLAEVGRLVTLLGWARHWFSAAKGRGRDLGDHEARIHPALAHQEGGQAREARVQQQRQAPLGDRADLGQRQRDNVGREGHGLGVEVAARDDLPRCR
ncbi:hypothetical protein ALISP_3722 [Alicycliphilus sp. B1]|nr:hypothetical protein ALISP_3722 [Alicycliphilus sp. B1]